MAELMQQELAASWQLASQQKEHEKQLSQELMQRVHQIQLC